MPSIKHSFVHATLAAAAMSQAGLAAAAACTATSPAHRLAVVELYTSEGCNSCPPADRWLSGLASARRNDALLALHVDYWDNLGWKDRFGDPAYTARQHALSRSGPSTFVYTPEIFVGGKEFRGWRSSASFDEAIAQVRRQTPTIDLALAATRDAQSIQVKADITRKQVLKSSQLVIALLEDGQSSAVRAGENRGETLKHDRIVRTWSGPLDLADRSATRDASGVISLERNLAIPPDADRAKLSLVAFVQDAKSGEIAQALTLPLTACTAR